MKKTALTGLRLLACALAVAGAGSASVMAETPSTTTATYPAARPTPTATSRMVNQYSAWAGSTQNAQSLVQGLRTGSLVTLTAPVATTDTSTVTLERSSFTPATAQLGVGEVNLALSLAKQSLAQQGITQPTPQQIAAALNGGMVLSGNTTVNLTGVLQQRQSGLGWGQIAQALGVKLGAVVSQSKTGKTPKTGNVAQVADNRSPPGVGQAQAHGNGNAGAGNNSGGNNSGGGHAGGNSGGGGGKK